MAYQHLMSWLRSLFVSSPCILVQSPTPSISLMGQVVRFIALNSVLLVAACDRGQNDPKPITQNLRVPERAAPVYMTDQVTIAGQNVSLWSDTGRCQLQSKHPKLKVAPLWLKPGAPCYFIKSPGADMVQVYQRDKTSRVLAVVGTPKAQAPIAERCGTDVQGVVLDASGKLRSSNTTQSGSLLCADQGLDHTQYELFAKD